MGSSDADKKAALAERKRKRLEAWRKRQQEQQAKEDAKKQSQQQSGNEVSNNNSTSETKLKSSSSASTKFSLSLKVGGNSGAKIGLAMKKKKKQKKKSSAFLEDFDNDDEVKSEELNQKKLLLLDDFRPPESMSESGISSQMKRKQDEGKSSGRTKKKRKWDVSSMDSDAKNGNVSQIKDAVEDDLDKFMNQLNKGAMGTVAAQNSALEVVSKSQNGGKKDGITVQNQFQMNSGGVMTPEMLAQLTSSQNEQISQDISKNQDNKNPDESEEHEENNDDEEEKARRSMLAALRKVSVPSSTPDEVQKPVVAQLASEVQSEKQRREAQMHKLKKDAENAQRAVADSSRPDIGRIYYDLESGVMEEAERNLDVMNNSSVDALEVLAELNKKKELKAVDHSQIEYLSIRKNLYIVPRSVANLSEDEVMERRAKHKIRVRGRGAPAPVETFEECGISERIRAILKKMNIVHPFAVQSQCLPCIMAGRDVIGIAKTGSGKTLAYLLPMLRHIGDQPPLLQNESGPIGLILAPARELAVQIHSVTKAFAKQLGIKSTAVYGGAGVAEQIADLKRGTEIVVGTPGRMIDILTMQAGKILSLKRVSYVVLDEADRMFDMGFSPQISAILAAVRPDRQTVLFSATFPKAVEALARKSLKYPIEVLIGGRSVASDSVKQHGEVIEEQDKFLRLLQLLGEFVDDEKKVIIFVDTQARADSVFEQLVRCGYPSLSLHGGKEQEDRDSTLSDFKRADGPNVLVATSVAGRGLDVASCICVINYSAPNHLEDYVHRIGRTGRAGNSGFAYTFVNSGDEAKFAPIVVRAMIEAGQADNISRELRKLSDDFKSKVQRGEARYAGSGFKGKGYTYDSNELNDAQKLARLEKRQALIEAGMIDPDDEDPLLQTNGESTNEDVASESQSNTGTSNPIPNSATSPPKPTNVALSADLLALPGMREAMMKKAGIEVPSSTSASGNHFVEEIDINDFPREVRWKLTQKDTTSRLQDEFQAAVTLKGQYIGPNTEPAEGERRLHLHVEATSERILQTCVQEIRRLLNEETLRVGAKGLGGSHKYNVL